MIEAQLCLLPSAIAELFAQVTHSGSLTLADRYGLLAAMLSDSLSDEERLSIDRLLRSVYRGTVVMVDELSAVSSFPA